RVELVDAGRPGSGKLERLDRQLAGQSRQFDRQPERRAERRQDGSHRRGAGGQEVPRAQRELQREEHAEGGSGGGERARRGGRGGAGSRAGEGAAETVDESLWPAGLGEDRGIAVALASSTPVLAAASPFFVATAIAPLGAIDATLGPGFGFV